MLNLFWITSLVRLQHQRCGMKKKCVQLALWKNMLSGRGVKETKGATEQRAWSGLPGFCKHTVAVLKTKEKWNYGVTDSSNIYEKQE